MSYTVQGKGRGMSLLMVFALHVRPCAVASPVQALLVTRRSLHRVPPLQR